MKQTIILKLLLIALFTSVIGACSEKSKTIPLQTIYSSNNCAIPVQVLKSINSATELDLLLQSFPKSFSNPSPINIQINYQKQVLILFALGRKPSSGYSIKLENKFAILKGEKLYLPISIHQPDESSYQAQLITSPCRIISIPKINFLEIRIGKE